MKSMTALHGASWIWLGRDGAATHQYVCFRKEFDLTNVDSGAIVDIAVDSDFVLYVNGTEIGRGQFSDYPERKTYTRIRVGEWLRPGRNVIAALAYHRGEDFHDHRKGRPGMILTLTSGDTRILTDSSFKCVQHPAFTSGHMPRVTRQQGFTTCFDGGRDIAFADPAFDDSGWPNAGVQAIGTEGYWKEIIPRPVPMLTMGEPVAVSLAQSGWIRREREYESFAETMTHDALTPAPDGILPDASDRRRGDGVYAIVDLGLEYAGLLTFDIEAPAGTILDIAHGEHLEDGRVRASVGGRNFADRYICKAGRNTYTLPFRRIGARYLEVHATNASSPMTLNYVGLMSVTLPGLETSPLHTSDDLSNQIHEIGLRTLTLCMHEHYEDTPWREQALYAFDGRNQALYGYYAFGNYDFAAASLDLLGRGIRPDGLLGLCAPARCSITIPSFSLVWITALREHWMHSGSSRLFTAFADQIADMVRAALANRDESTSLYSPPNTPEMWHFYEWTPGLSRKIGQNDIVGEIHAAYNLFLHEALGSYAAMLEASGSEAIALEYQGIQRDLGMAIHAAFWREEAARYATVLVDGKPDGFHKLIQVLALSCGIVPEADEASVIKTLSHPDCQEITLSSAIYLVKALMDRSPDCRKIVSSFIARHWSPMIAAGATTCWETQHGAADFNNAGSLCHGWSALPVYYYHAHILGIRPLTPGFVEFQICPCNTNFTEASGHVHTPYGNIIVSWIEGEKGIILTATGPEECRPELRTLPEFEISEATYNGNSIIG
jgi:alpha-L-rhamnosidase